jgi:MtrB/PioB family decaheme-associated outer membrane protein
MGRLLLIRLVCCLGLLMPAAAGAQSAAQPPATPPSKPPVGTQEKPQAPAATPVADAAEEGTRSLFEQTWRQFQFGGRVSSISGDPARYQRYGDFRDGILFTDMRYAGEQPDGNYTFHTAVDNLGWRDQRLYGDYERPGKFLVSGLWDQIPQFYSVDTATPYTTSGGGDLVLDDAAQRSNQNASTPTLNLYLPLAQQFDLRERRDVGRFNFVATPTPQLDVKASFTTNRHVGELPWGASFGFSNDVEVALPYDSRANDFSIGTEWTNSRNMIRVSYDGSWFDNLDPILVWDSPLDLTDGVETPGRGRMTLWPSNSAQTVSVGGFTKFARKTQLTGFLSLGSWSNDEPLQPFTINSALPQLALPRATTEGSAKTFSTNLNLVSRPADEWRVGARFRSYNFNNETPRALIPEYVSYDSEAGPAVIDGPRLYAHSRTTFDADATYTGFAPLALTAGYTHNGTGHDFRIYESTGEDILRLVADAVGSQWVTFRAEYEFADKRGSGLDESVLTEIHEQPQMRHYDIANRNRKRFTGLVNLLPNELWSFTASAGFGGDDYDGTYFGLQESDFKTFSLGADYQGANGFGGGVTYNYENYKGLQQSRSASPGASGGEFDPNRDWTADTKEVVHYFSIYAMPPRLGRNTEARISYDFSHAEASYFYGVVPGGPLPAPSQLPNVFNKLQQLHLDVRHRLSNRLAATLSYLYEPFDVYDFAFDQTVVNSIVQPSSLVLGYVYRPYTAHTFMFGVRYFW